MVTITIIRMITTITIITTITMRKVMTNRADAAGEAPVAESESGTPAVAPVEAAAAEATHRTRS